MSKHLNGRGRRNLRRWVLEEFGDGTNVNCFLCGVTLTNETMTLDRIVPGSKGGTYCRANVRPACRSCNEWLADHGTEFWNRPVMVELGVRRSKFRPTVASMITDEERQALSAYRLGKG